MDFYIYDVYNICFLCLFTAMSSLFITTMSSVFIIYVYVTQLSS